MTDGDDSVGNYRDLIAVDELSLLISRPGGLIEQSSASVAIDLDGKTRCIQSFPSLGDFGESAKESFDFWKKLSNNSTCPFSIPLLDAFYESGSFNLVYEHDGGATSLANLLQSGQSFYKEREREEELMDIWIGQLIWTIRYIHQSCQFVGFGILSNPQNILISSQLQRLSIAGLGAIQLLSLCRSPLEYSQSEIRSQQLQDFKALADLIKSFLSGSRRWMIRSPKISAIMAYLEKRSPASSALELANLPASQSALQKVFLKSFKRQSYLENQLMIQVQSERVLGLLCKLNFVTDHFEREEDLKSWPSRKPLQLLKHHLFGRKSVNSAILDLDLVQVVEFLRQVDSGSEDRILLVSADTSSSIVVSYAELGFYLEEAYQLLLLRS